MFIHNINLHKSESSTIYLSLTILYGFLLVMQSCTSQPDIRKSEIFNFVEPQVRVRIVNTLDTVQIRFLDDWNGYLNDRIANEFGKDEQINIKVSDNLICFSKNVSSNVITCDSLILKSSAKAGELEIKNVLYGDGRPVPDLNTEDKVRKWIFSQPNVFCNPYLETELPEWSQKNFRWQKKITSDSLTKMISGNRDLGKLVNIRALKRGLSGRMNRARFIFEQDSFEVTGELAIRQMWHPALRSACFVVDQEGGNFILTGAGWGHGVGMCQTGAVAQAIRGLDFKSILQHYYYSADIVSIY